MRRSIWFADRSSLMGWMTSLVAHQAILLVAALLLMPSGDGVTELLEVEVDFKPPGAELVTFDSEAPSLRLEADDAPATFLTDTSIAVDVAVPAQLLTAGSGDGGAASHSGTRRGSAGGSGRASFFGTLADGDRFVYVLDVSPSMNARRGKRLERAMLELLQSVDGLRSDQEFYVIVFGWKFRRMFDERWPSMARATVDNKRRLRDWLASLDTITGTDPRQALQIGLGLQPSAVFLLSDGEFNEPPANSRSLFGDEDLEVEQIVSLQNPGATPVHTVAFEDPVSAPRMTVIAEMTGGQHRFVEAPSKARAGKKGLRYNMYRSTQFAIKKYRFSEPSPFESDDGLALPDDSDTSDANIPLGLTHVGPVPDFEGE